MTESNLKQSSHKFVHLQSIDIHNFGEQNSRHTLTTAASVHDSRDIFRNSIRKILQLSKDLDQSKRDLFANPDFNM